MQFRILGPFDTGEMEAGGRRQRSVLAVLLLSAGRTVSIDQLVDGVWDGAPPESARHLVQTYVSALRPLLPTGVVLYTRPPGYALELPAGYLDATRFERLVAEARRVTGAEALALYDSALALWRGPALADLSLGGEAGIDVERLDALHATVEEERLESALAAGRDRELIPELERLVRAEPLRERPTELLMLALYRSGRQSEALTAYRKLRARLADELGVEPAPALRELERAILQHDPGVMPRQSAQYVEPLPRRSARATMIVGSVAIVSAIAIIGVVAFAAFQPSSKAVALRKGDVAVIDHGRVVRATFVGGTPGRLAVRHGVAWITDDVRPTITEVTDEVVRRAPLAATASAVTSAGGLPWVGLGFTGRVQRLEPGRGPAPTPLEPRAAGRLALAADGSSVWAASQDGVVVRVDAQTAHVADSVPVSIPVSAIASDGSAAWVADANRDQLVRVIRAARPLLHVPIGGLATSLAMAAGSVWAATPATGRVWRVDEKTGVVTASFPSPGRPSLVAVSDGLVWVAPAQLPELIALDPKSGAQRDLVQLPAPARGLESDGSQLWVTFG